MTRSARGVVEGSAEQSAFDQQRASGRLLLGEDGGALPLVIGETVDAGPEGLLVVGPARSSWSLLSTLAAAAGLGAASVFQAGTGGGEAGGGLSALVDGLPQGPHGSVHLAGAVGGNTGVELGEPLVPVVGGLAEPFGAVGQGVPGAHTGNDRCRPSSARQAGGADAPRCGAIPERRRTALSGLLRGEAGHVGAGVADRVTGARFPGGGFGEGAVEVGAFGPAPDSDAGEGPKVAAAVAAPVQVGDGAGVVVLSPVEGVDGAGQLRGAVGGTVPPHLEVVLSQGADRPVERVGVGAGGHRPLRGPSQRHHDGLTGGTVIGQAATMVGIADRDCVPGVGGLTGAGPPGRHPWVSAAAPISRRPDRGRRRLTIRRRAGAIGGRTASAATGPSIICAGVDRARRGHGW